MDSPAVDTNLQNNNREPELFNVVEEATRDADDDLSSSFSESEMPKKIHKVAEEGSTHAKEPRVGSEYQLVVRPFRGIPTPSTPIMGATLSSGTMQWDPSETDPENVREYLSLVQEMYGFRDFSEEQALRALQFHNHNYHAALLQMFEYPLPAHHPEDNWRKDEMDLFEKGLRRYGKDFRAIHELMGTRSVRQIIHMYYRHKNRQGYIKRVRSSLNPRLQGGRTPGVRSLMTVAESTGAEASARSETEMETQA